MSGTTGLIEQDEFDWLLAVQFEIRYIAGSVLDLGSGNGTGSTRALVLGQKKWSTGKTVLCVDTWTDEEVEADFERATAPVRHRIRKFKGTAREFWASPESGLVFAFSFLDQTNKDDAAHDISEAWSRTTPGGYVAIHDRQYADVAAAAQSLGLTERAGSSILHRKKG